MADNQLIIDDLKVAFHNKAVTLELISGDHSIKHCVDLELAKHLVMTPSTTGMSDHDALVTQVCSAVEIAFIECKLLALTFTPGDDSDV